MAEVEVVGHTGRLNVSLKREEFSYLVDKQVEEKW
jgi:hypothetical protein